MFLAKWVGIFVSDPVRDRTGESKHNGSMKNVLVVGGGGREHALAWKLSQSNRIGNLFVSPGNAGTAHLAQNIPISSTDIPALIKFAKQNAIDLTVVGPDNSLAAGIVDSFQAHGLKIFGPTKKAAEIEWSKVFAKKLMKKYNIPTAKYASFSSYEPARRYISTTSFPTVIKVDGLALGKGVFICESPKEAKKALTAIMRGKDFGSSGTKIVIEEYLEGIEVSAHAICDGSNFLLFPLAQDHKRIGEGNTGPNTGGMGTICPVPGPVREISGIIRATLEALQKEGRYFSGCLFPGIMHTSKGPKVLEYNARFGDPETQVYMRLLKNDLLEVLEAATEKRLGNVKLEWQTGAAACIVLASLGYPGKYKQGFEIGGIEERSGNETVIFHAGTKLDGDRVLTAGGRVLNVTATGANLGETLELGYKAAGRVSFEGKVFRKDIGFQFGS